MDSNWQHFTKFFQEHGGELILCFHEVYRLVGLEYGDDDYYWHLKSFDGKSIYDSCLGRLVPLKEALAAEFYDYLDTFYFPENAKLRQWKKDIASFPTTR